MVTVSMELNTSNLNTNNNDDGHNNDDANLVMFLTNDKLRKLERMDSICKETIYYLFSVPPQ